MSKNNKRNNYVLPALGVAGFGLPALTLHGLDKSLANAGLSRDLVVPKETVSALEDFAKLRVGDVADPAMYFPEYVDRANKAVNSRLFGSKSPLTVANSLNESVISKAPRRLAENWSFLDRFGSFGKNLRKTIAGLSYSLPQRFQEATEAAAAAGEDIVARNKALLQKALASHIPGLAGSYEDAYLRLLNEMAGVSVDKRGNPLFAARGKTDQLAKDLYEAVVNHTKPTRAGFVGGKTFGSASSYLDALWHNTAREGGLQAVPGVYRRATNIAADIINKADNEEAAIQALTNLLGGKNKNLYKTLRENYGTAAEFGLAEEGGDKILKILPGKEAKRLGKATSKAKAIDLGLKDLATAIFHGDATRLFTGSIMYHQNEPAKVKALNIIQKIRNPYLRAALGAGALGSAGLLTHRIIENKKANRSWLEKLKDMFRK